MMILTRRATKMRREIPIGGFLITTLCRRRMKTGRFPFRFTIWQRRQAIQPAGIFRSFDPAPASLAQQVKCRGKNSLVGHDISQLWPTNDVLSDQNKTFQRDKFALPFPPEESMMTRIVASLFLGKNTRRNGIRSVKGTSGELLDR
jgi:hypothetical protein